MEVWRKSLGWKLQKLLYLDVFSHLINTLSSFVTSSPELGVERFLWRWFSQTPWSHTLNIQSHWVLSKCVVEGWGGPSWGQTLVMMHCIIISFLLCHLTIYRFILQLRIFYDSMIPFSYMNYSTVIGMPGPMVNCSKDIHFSLTCHCFLPLLQNKAVCCKSFSVCILLISLIIVIWRPVSFLQKRNPNQNKNKQNKAKQRNPNNFYFTHVCFGLKRKPLIYFSCSHVICKCWL